MVETKTLVIDNFAGAMTTYLNGKINSGRSWTQTSAGQNPFIKPGQLTWSQSPVQIDPTGSVITDLIMVGKERVESGILYIYAVGHTGRVYKIQVNDPTSYNPDYDNPVLLATLSINSPTFTRGGSIDFFGTTEKIYIGHDQGVTTLKFDGTSEAFVGILGSWTQNVPRPLKQYVGNLYAGNGVNFTEILSSETVSTYAKLAPGFPVGTQIRDLDVSPDGTYLETVVSRLALFDITSSAQQTTSTSNSDSFIFKWNGTDTGYTSFSTFSSFALNANTVFQNYQYTFGTDQFGSAVYSPNEKIITIPEAPAPLPNAIVSTGNMFGMMTPLYFNAQLQGSFTFWGSNDFEVGTPIGFWNPFFTIATAPETDIIQIPCVLLVSNTGFGSSSNGYPNNVFGTSKIYFSQLETSITPTTKYRFYKWSISTSNLQSPVVTNAINRGAYQTQTELFSKKIRLSEVRVYGEPWLANSSFSIDIVGSSELPMAGASKTFTAGSNLTVGSDFAWYTPQAAPTYAVGVLITNLGTTNHVINKIEVDYSEAGK